MAAPKKQNYLNNKDILKDIHKSKMTFCYVEDKRYYQYDLILDDVSEINSDALQQAKESKASRIQQERYAEAIANLDKKDGSR